MERKPEQKAWDAMRVALRAYVSTLHMQRFENGVGEGPGDVLALGRSIVEPRRAGEGIVTWIELKAVKAPARITSKVLGSKGLRRSQKNWALDWRNYSGRYIVGVRIELGEDNYTWAFVGGQHADAVNDMNLQQLFAAAFISGRTPWAQLADALRRRGEIG